MSSRLLQELQPVRNKLEKLTTAESEPCTEEVQDLIRVIKSHELTAEVIQRLDLGPIVRKLSNRLTDAPLKAEMIAILKSWKDKIVAAKSQSSSTGETKKKSTAVAPEPAEFVIRLPTAGERESALIKKVELTGERRPIFTALSTFLAQSLASDAAEQLALMIERELHSAYSGKTYTSKARLIVTNLKNNHVLLNDVLQGHVTADRLVHMTPSELASKEAKEARQKILKEDAEARQLNWFEEHRAEIQKHLGLDPENKWDYDDDDEGLSDLDVEAPDN